MKLLLTNIRQLLTLDTSQKKLRRGKEMQQIGLLESAWLLISDGMVAAYGTMEQSLPVADESLDCHGKIVFPGLIDSHTHLVFAKPREQEFVQKIQGKSYEEIAASGGGILNSAKKIAETPEEELVDSARKRLTEILKTGTTVVEIKSGYGLTPESELKMLRVANHLKQVSPQQIFTTFLGAHTYPAAFKQNHRAYLDQIIQEMLPEIQSQKLADFIDVFCETGFFSPEETIEILEAGKTCGLKPRVHANELGLSGGVQAGVEVGARSVDHLEWMGEAEIQALANSDTVPTLLPSTALFLKMEFAPARKLIDAGLGVALASDYNPGTSPSGNLLFVWALACMQMRMSPEEAITALTHNAAVSLDCESVHGSLAPGKQADFVITEPMDHFYEIPYFFTKNPIESVWIKGKRVC